MSKFKTHTAKDIYKKFKNDNSNSDVTYTFFKYIVSEHNKKLINRILDGITVNLGSKLGKLRIKKVERNFYKKTIDWGETRKLKAEGINKHVYYTDNYWFRWYWEKISCQIKNKSVYQFKPTAGDFGNRKRLVKILMEDEFSHTIYAE